jgi:hypothetical protein
MITEAHEAKLIELCRSLIDQQRAKVVVPPYAGQPGYWFGGGNLVSAADGTLYLIGRYRNAGDSRTGVAAGSRGLELAIFRSADRGESFQKVVQFSKDDLRTDADHAVLSIEGSALRFDDRGVEVYVSTEKDSVGYPAEFADFLKPGTGVWSIDRLQAGSVEALKNAAVEPVLASTDPATVHVKDPFVYEAADGPLLFFCSHPFSWTCSGTGFAPIQKNSNGCGSATFDVFPRGNVWDVAMSRGTCVIDVPPIGPFRDSSVQLMFYDGGECVRDHQQHARSVERPRGHSCEEIGGAAYFTDRRWDHGKRLSRYRPLFVSPYGTGCSRYADVLVRPEGLYATWQQSRGDGSQPTVLHFLPQDAVESILGG